MGICHSKPGHDEERERPSQNENDELARRGTFEPAERLLTIPFFHDLDRKKVKELRELFARRRLHGGEVIVREGRDEKCNGAFFVIVQGLVQISARNAQGHAVELQRLKAGDWFGDTSLQEDSLAPTTATSLEEDTVILSMTAEEFRHAIDRFPELGVSIDVVGRNPPLKVQLKKIPFFADVPENRLQVLGTLCAVRSAKAGTKICTQGDEADGYYYIIQGRVEVSACSRTGATPRSSVGGAPTEGDGASTATEAGKLAASGGEEFGREVHLDTLSAGDGFGEIALLEQTRRTATVTAREDCTLVYISRDNFQRFQKLAPEAVKNVKFEEIVRRRTANSLKAIPIFSVLIKKRLGPFTQFDEERLTLLGALFRFVQKAPGETICKEGEPGEGFFIIVRGKVSVSAKAPDNQEVALHELSANDWFGEGTLLHNPRSNCTVTAASNCVLLMLRSHNYDKFLEIAPELRDVLRSRISMRTAERMRKVPFFANLKENKPWSKLDLLGGLFVFEEFEAGQVVVEENTVGDRSYVLVSGEVDVTVTNPGDAQPTKLDTLKADAFFGEIALIKATPRTATVRCVSDCTLLSITADKFIKFLSVAPELANDFNNLVSKRVANVLRSLAFFKNIKEDKPWNKIELMASLFEFHQVEPGDVIYREGEPADTMFVIFSGKVHLKEPRYDAPGAEPTIVERTIDSQAGQHFGSAAVVRAAAVASKAEGAEGEGEGDGGAAAAAAGHRLGSATAVTRCSLLAMDAEVFFQLLRLAPELCPIFEEAVREQTGESISVAQLVGVPSAEEEERLVEELRERDFLTEYKKREAGRRMQRIPSGYARPPSAYAFLTSSSSSSPAVSAASVHLEIKEEQPAAAVAAEEQEESGLGLGGTPAPAPAPEPEPEPEPEPVAAVAAEARTEAEEVKAEAEAEAEAEKETVAPEEPKAQEAEAAPAAAGEAAEEGKPEEGQPAPAEAEAEAEAPAPSEQQQPAEQVPEPAPAAAEGAVEQQQEQEQESEPAAAAETKEEVEVVAAPVAASEASPRAAVPAEEEAVAVSSEAQQEEEDKPQQAEEAAEEVKAEAPVAVVEAEVPEPVAVVEAAAAEPAAVEAAAAAVEEAEKEAEVAPEEVSVSIPCR